MNKPGALDPDLLRAFAYIAEEGSFTRAAQRIGRTQSAVSMQVQRLESLLQQRLISRGKGGRLHLTAHGQQLLGKSRELLALHDDIWNSFHTPTVQGTVRLGSPDDYALRYLPEILMRFSAQYPSVDVEVLCLPSHELVGRLLDEELDLTLISDGHEPPQHSVTRLWRGPLAWVTSERNSPHRRDPLPLALAAPDSCDKCQWRRSAIDALEAAGRRFRIAYNSSTQVGTYAPALAGLAVTVSTSSWLPEGLRPVLPEEGLPPLPMFGISLLQAPRPRQPVTDALTRYITETFAAEAGPARTTLAQRAA